MHDETNINQTYKITIDDYLILTKTTKKLSTTIKMLKNGIDNNYNYKAINLVRILWFIICSILVYLLLIQVNKLSLLLSCQFIPTMCLALYATSFQYTRYDVENGIYFTRIWHKKYRKYKHNSYRTIKVTYNNDIKPIDMKKLPEYQDIKCLNIPKDIYYLLITNHWFIMLNTDYKIIGYFPRLAKTKHDKDRAFYNYVTNNCNVKHTFISFVPILGLGHSF